MKEMFSVDEEGESEQAGDLDVSFVARCQNLDLVNQIYKLFFMFCDRCMSCSSLGNCMTYSIIHRKKSASGYVRVQIKGKIHFVLAFGLQAVRHTMHILSTF